MSYETSVAVVARLRFDQILTALEEWAETHERAAGFSHVDDRSYASHAWVIVGHVNHLDHESLLAAIRDAAGYGQWGEFEPVGVLFCSEEGAIWNRQLGEDGTWR